MDIALWGRWAIIAFFVLWFALSCLTQAKGTVRTTIKAFDFLELLPIWTFFGPRPMNSDLVLQFRDFDAAGAIGVWRTVHTNPRRRWFHLWWNPQRRVHGTLINLSRRLPPQPTAADMASFRTTANYRAIRSVVLQLPRQRDTVARQFMFLGERRLPDGTMSRHPLFLSEKSEFDSDVAGAGEATGIFCVTDEGRRT